MGGSRASNIDANPVAFPGEDRKQAADRLSGIERGHGAIVLLPGEGSVVRVLRQLIGGYLAAGIIGFDGNTEPEALRLHALPKHAPALLCGTQALPGGQASGRQKQLRRVGRCVEDGQTPAEMAPLEAELRPPSPALAAAGLGALHWPGACTEKLHLFSRNTAPGTESGRAPGCGREGEEIEVIEMPLAEAWTMVERGEIVDAKMVLLLQHLLPARCGAVAVWTS
jgi:hypothetical protein